MNSYFVKGTYLRFVKGFLTIIAYYWLILTYNMKDQQINITFICDNFETTENTAWCTLDNTGSMLILKMHSSF